MSLHVQFTEHNPRFSMSNIMSLPGTLTCTTPSKGFTLNSEGTMVAYQMCFTKISTLRWCSWLCWWWWCLWGKCTFNILLWKTWMAGWANKPEIHSRKVKDISGSSALGNIKWAASFNIWRCLFFIDVFVMIFWKSYRPQGLWVVDNID